MTMTAIAAPATLPIMRVTALDTPVPYAPTLEEFFLPNKEKVLHAARTLAKY